MRTWIFEVWFNIPIEPMLLPHIWLQSTQCPKFFSHCKLAHQVHFAVKVPDSPAPHEKLLFLQQNGFTRKKSVTVPSHVHSVNQSALRSTLPILFFAQPQFGKKRMSFFTYHPLENSHLAVAQEDLSSDFHSDLTAHLHL